MLGDYEDRIDHLLAEPGIGAADAAAKGLAAAQGEVLHLLHPGDVMEPVRVLRIAEYFARRPGVHAAYAEDAWTTGQGWKFPAPPQPTADVAHPAARPHPFAQRRLLPPLGVFRPAR